MQEEFGFLRSQRGGNITSKQFQEEAENWDESEKANIRVFAETENGVHVINQEQLLLKQKFLQI